MPYLICDKCNVYYEIKNKSEMDDFTVCECGNMLKFYETIDDYMNEEIETPDSNNDEHDVVKHFKCSNEDLLVIMNTLSEDQEKKHKEHLQRDENYKIKHQMQVDKEKMNSSNNHYEPIIVREFGDKSLKKKKEILLMEMELLKESKK